MATISIETKKFADFESILTAPDEGIILIHDGKGVKKIKVEDFKADLMTLITANATLLEKITQNNAGAHNSIYRGKNLGTSVTPEQYAAIAAGTFDDLYIGDYWTINGRIYRIAAFDYYLNTGDQNCTTHHVTLVPDVNMYTAVMNSTATMAGGYTGSEMYTSGLDNAKNTINSDFGSAHILKHRLYLDNTVTNGYPSARAWFDSTVELMSEQNVYGGKVYAGIVNGTNVPNMSEVDKSQYPLFALEPSRITNGATYWLRNVVSASGFSRVANYGYALGAGNASTSLGVRPAFSIVS